MKLRKSRSSENYTTRIEALAGDKWLPLEAIENIVDIAKQCDVEGDLNTDMLAVLQLGKAGWDSLSAALDKVAETYNDSDGQRETVQPFQPASFREFALFEEHYVNMGRQHVKNYMKNISPVVSTYEKLTKKTFPAFKPKAIWYQQPTYYYGNHLNFYSDREVIEWPNFVEDMDYEIEVGAIVSKKVLNVTGQAAADAIGGFVIVNDLSSRGNAFKDEAGSGCGPQKSKHFANSMSDVVVTADEILGSERKMTGRVKLNGKTVCECKSEAMQFTFTEIVEFLAGGQTLYPGELLASGTLPGGSGIENGNMPKPGDHLVMEIDGLGELENTFGSRS